jgi:hypothetical protein
MIKFSNNFIIFSLLIFVCFHVFANQAKSQSVNTANIIIKYYTSTKNRDYPLINEVIIIKSANQTFEAKTNKKGLVKFSNIACDQEISIFFQGIPTAIFKRYLVCGKPANFVYFFNSFAEEGKQVEQIK